MLTLKVYTMSQPHCILCTCSIHQREKGESNRGFSQRRRVFSASPRETTWLTTALTKAVLN
jgi:hypothetical protein